MFSRRLFSLISLFLPGTDSPALFAETTLSLSGNRWYINGKITNPNSAAEGLLMNVRMVNATFEDRAKPDFNPEANTDAFVRHIPEYAAYGVNAFTLCLQGGNPGYEGAVNSAFEPDGSLRPAYLRRVERVLRACDQQGVAVILTYYYQRQCPILRDESAVRAGVANATRWVIAQGFHHVLIEVANEFGHGGFAPHPIIRRPEGQAGLLRLVKQIAPHLLVTASGYGNGRIPPPVAEACDFLTPHWNIVNVADIPERIAMLQRFGKPLVCNEDLKEGAEQTIAALRVSVENGCAYGLMEKDVNQTFPFQFHGAADNPAFYAALRAITSARRPPNLLFILADDLGWQDTSMTLGPSRTEVSARYHTPAIERLAREGMRFTQAYSCTVCSPSRVSFLTGLNEARHAVTQWTNLSGPAPNTDLPHPTLTYAPWNWNGLQPQPGLEASVFRPTLPALLRAAGYRTMIFGKGHLGAAGTPGADPKEFGFDVRIGGRDAGGIGSYWGTRHFGAKANPNTLLRARDLDHYFGQDIHLTEALTREAAREIRAAVADRKPFFCYFAHFAPHMPLEPDERFAPAYRATGLDETEAAYASLIAGLDKSIGDLLALLDELGIADNTLVVFTSDNGGLSHSQRSMEKPHTHNAPLSSGKGSHHEGGIRVPLVARWPGVARAGAISAESVILYDWTRTLLECGGAEVPPDLDGRSLLPLLRGERGALPERSLVWHFPNFWGPPRRPGPVEGPGMGPSSTIRRGDWKLIYYHTDRRFELFNLAADLGETHNLAAREPERVRTLADELSAYLRRHHAPMPVVKSTGAPVPLPAEALAATTP